MTQASTARLLAIDPSLTASGWAIFSRENDQLLEFGVISPPGPKNVLAERLKILQMDVESLIRRLGLGQQDILICEGPAPLVLNPSSALKVEQVRSVFEAVARNFSVSVPGRLNPRTIQSELLGMKGRQLKREAVKNWARETAYKLYQKELNSYSESRAGRAVPQDIIDAVLVGTLALSKVKLSMKQGQNISSAFATKTPSRRSSGKGGRGLSWTDADLKGLRIKS